MDKTDAPHDEDTRDDLPWIYKAEMEWAVDDLCRAARELRLNPWGRLNEEERERLARAQEDLSLALAQDDLNAALRRNG